MYIPEHIDLGGGLYRCTECNGLVWEDRHLHTRRSMKVRKKPVEVEAVKLGWDTWDEICDFVGVGDLEDGKPTGGYVDSKGNFSQNHIMDSKIALAIPTLEGLIIGVEGDWIIKGVKGEIYPCKPDIFEATYDILEEV